MTRRKLGCISTAQVQARIQLWPYMAMGGKKGKRFAMPNARIMIHQPQGGCGPILYHTEKASLRNYDGHTMQRRSFEKTSNRTSQIIDTRDLRWGIQKITHALQEEQRTHTILESKTEFKKN